MNKIQQKIMLIIALAGTTPAEAMMGRTLRSASQLFTKFSEQEKSKEWVKSGTSSALLIGTFLASHAIYEHFLKDNNPELLEKEHWEKFLKQPIPADKQLNETFVAWAKEQAQQHGFNNLYFCYKPGPSVFIEAGTFSDNKNLYFELNEAFIQATHREGNRIQKGKLYNFSFTADKDSPDRKAFDSLINTIDLCKATSLHELGHAVHKHKEKRAHYLSFNLPLNALVGATVAQIPCSFIKHSVPKTLLPVLIGTAGAAFLLKRQYHNNEYEADAFAIDALKKMKAESVLRSFRFFFGILEDLSGDSFTHPDPKKRLAIISKGLEELEKNSK